MNENTDTMDQHTDQPIDQSPAPETAPVVVDADTDTDTDTRQSAAADGTSNDADDVALVRDFVVTSDGALVAELVGGRTVGEVLASVETARAAYRRIAERVRAGQPDGDGDAAGPVAVAPPTPLAAPTNPAPLPFVPAGGTTPFAIDLATLPTSELLRRGLERVRQTTGG